MNSLPVLVVRSTAFYAGYVSVTIVMSLFFISLFPLLSDKGRYRFAVSWCDFILNWLRLSCGVKYTVEGKDNLPGQPVVILANHQSSWETVLIYKLVYPVSPILKRELVSIPFWGWALRLQKPIAIDRSKPREAGKSLLTQGVVRLGQGNSVVVFPEGTRSAQQSVKRFSRGGAKLASAAGVPIVPVVHNAGLCWPPHQFIKHPGTVRLVIGEPIITNGRDENELTQQAEDWIRERLTEINSSSIAAAPEL